MFKKKLLTVHLNEFNYEFLLHGSKKYNCKNLSKILKYKKTNTYSKDKIQDKDLDPWVQTVTINTGKSSDIHKIYKTGQSIPKGLNQIWDELSKKKINSAIWGTMNTHFKNSIYIKVFFPDPWNNQVKIKPYNLKNLYKLPRNYAENYTDFKITHNVKNIIVFFSACLKHIPLINLSKISKIFLTSFLSRGFKNYNLFFLFDLISINIFENNIKNRDIEFAHIFLNSLAHFQHNNWDEIKNHKFYFKYTDEICKKILDLSKNYDQIIIYNGFTQKKIRTEYLMRPINPSKFLKNIGINFKKLKTNMTNGGILEFNNDIKKRENVKKLKKYSLCGYKVFEIKDLSKLKVFFRIQLKAFKIINENDSKKFIKENIAYDSINKIKIIKNLKYEKGFFKEMKFLKTTGKHFPNGKILSKTSVTNKKIIENKNIFQIVRNFFEI